jgi:hypothetical protein
MGRSTATAGSTTQIDYTVLDGRARTVELRVGDSWSFGRSPRCSQTLALPDLSRLCLVLQSVAPGLVRVVSRQSNRGRVHVVADEGTERHVIGLGSGPVHLAGGNYTLKVELPPVVLRGQIAIPLRGEARQAMPHRGVGAASERTRMSCDPHPGDGEGMAWIAVTAMAVTLARFPELGGGSEPSQGLPVRPSETLRRAVALWTGHSSHYWVNERLREAAEAADLHVKEGRDRVAVVVTHYAPFFSDAALRRMRDELVVRGLPGRRAS